MMCDEGRWVDRVDPATELWAAARVIAMHEHGERCGTCHREGCRLLTWAVRLRQEAEHAGTPVPGAAPDCPPFARYVMPPHAFRPGTGR